MGEAPTLLRWPAWTEEETKWAHKWLHAGSPFLAAARVYWTAPEWPVVVIGVTGEADSIGAGSFIALGVLVTSVMERDLRWRVVPKTWAEPEGLDAEEWPRATDALTALLTLMGDDAERVKVAVRESKVLDRPVTLALMPDGVEPGPYALHDGDTNRVPALILLDRRMMAELSLPRPWMPMETQEKGEEK